MARHLADDNHTFRAVVTTVTEYADGRPARTYVEYFGPYAHTGIARAQITRMQRSAERGNHSYGERRGWTEAVTGRVETAVTTWERVDS